MIASTKLFDLILNLLSTDQTKLQLQILNTWRNDLNCIFEEEERNKFQIICDKLNSKRIRRETTGRVGLAKRKRKDDFKHNNKRQQQVDQFGLSFWRTPAKVECFVCKDHIDTEFCAHGVDDYCHILCVPDEFRFRFQRLREYVLLSNNDLIALQELLENRFKKKK
jgi:hypothetical protein